jgi:magnesium-transporting ATPase (P-type)
MTGWIPSGISWLRTIILLLVTSATVGGLRIFSTYGEYFTYATRHLGFFIFMSLIGLFLPFIAYAYIHCWLLGNKPKGWDKKIPSPSSIKESLLSFVVLIFGVIANLLIVVIPFTTGYLTNSDIERLASIASFTWLVITIYMFHAYDLITRPHQQKSDKSKPETPKSKIDPIDRELNHLKHKTGIHFRETPKK